MNMSDWKKMVSYIQDYYQYFDGFLLLHGTDTMAFTSSALSFMLENLEKAVVITGSQVPLFELRTDAVDNLKGSLIMSGRYAYDIPEVTLFFNNKLLRGNRSTKINADAFEAFDSPDLHPLATVGVDINGKPSIIQRVFIVITNGSYCLHWLQNLKRSIHNSKKNYFLASESTLPRFVVLAECKIQFYTRNSYNFWNFFALCENIKYCCAYVITVSRLI